MRLTPTDDHDADRRRRYWDFQLRLTSPTDPRLQQFVNTFRDSPKYTPEYGGPCTGGLGTPLQT